MKTNRIVPLLGLLLAAVAPTAAQEAATRPATTTNTVAAGAGLPQAHQSQEQLSAFMAMLLAKDRTQGVTEKSESPTAGDGNFIRVFEVDFVVARQPGFAAVIHAGPLGAQAPDGNTGPMGMGGGQLSAFWTPGTGPVILCLRGGITLGSLDSWQTWPIHAVSGVTGSQDGAQFFTSARIAKPEVVADVKDSGATVTVSGPLVAMKKVVKGPGAAEAENAKSAMHDDQLKHQISYTRTFKITGKGVRVETTVNGDGAGWIAQAVETIPVYLGAGQEKKANANVKIEVQKGGKWVPLTEGHTSAGAIRITRFGHAVMVTFDKDRYRRPARVALAPADWTDNYPDKYATCRNIMMTLASDLDMSFGGVNFTDQKERKFVYEITPVDEPAQSQPEAK